MLAERIPPAEVAAPDPDVDLTPVASASPDPVPPRRRHRIGLWLAVGWVVAIVCLSFAASWLPLRDPGKVGTDLLRPAHAGWPDPLGTDQLGRSQLSRIVYGARVSILVGLGAVGIAFVIGGAVGVIAGFYRGRVEKIIDVLTDSAMAFPGLVLLLTISAVFGQTFRNLVISLALLLTPLMIRVARANTLAYVNRDFVLAARVLGARRHRIIVREILPNVIPPLVSMTFIAIGGVIVAEGSLSFLGRGIPPPTPSWGGMIAAGRTKIETDSQLVMVPGIALFITVFAFNTIGDHLRSRFDTRGDVR